MSEAIYDEKIAPLLREAGRICKEHGLPLVAVVEYAPGDFGQTTNRTADEHITMIMTEIAARAQGNLDALVLSVLRHCRERGIDTSASIYATMYNRVVSGKPSDEKVREAMDASTQDNARAMGG